MHPMQNARVVHISSNVPFSPNQRNHCILYRSLVETYLHYLHYKYNPLLWWLGPHCTSHLKPTQNGFGLRLQVTRNEKIDRSQSCDQTKKICRYEDCFIFWPMLRKLNSKSSSKQNCGEVNKRKVRTSTQLKQNQNISRETFVYCWSEWMLQPSLFRQSFQDKYSPTPSYLHLHRVVTRYARSMSARRHCWTRGSSHGGKLAIASTASCACSAASSCVFAIPWLFFTISKACKGNISLSNSKNHCTN